MKVDQSMITGESEPVESVVNAADPNSLEARNIIFNGSLGTCSTVRHRVVLYWLELELGLGLALV